ncbi:hypothetical protein JCM11251_003538 [Rhodosporidiobolus azoricus]
MNAADVFVQFYDQPPRFIRANQEWNPLTPPSSRNAPSETNPTEGERNYADTVLSTKDGADALQKEFTRFMAWVPVHMSKEGFRWEGPLSMPGLGPHSEDVAGTSEGDIQSYIDKHFVRPACWLAEGLTGLRIDAVSSFLAPRVSTTDRTATDERHGRRGVAVMVKPKIIFTSDVQKCIRRHAMAEDDFHQAAEILPQSAGSPPSAIPPFRSSFLPSPLHPPSSTFPPPSLPDRSSTTSPAPASARTSSVPSSEPPSPAAVQRADEQADVNLDAASIPELMARTELDCALSDATLSGIENHPCSRWDPCGWAPKGEKPSPWADKGEVEREGTSLVNELADRLASQDVADQKADPEADHAGASDPVVPPLFAGAQAAIIISEAGALPALRVGTTLYLGSSISGGPSVRLWIAYLLLLSAEDNLGDASPRLLEKVMADLGEPPPPAASEPSDVAFATPFDNVSQTQSRPYPAGSEELSCFHSRADLVISDVTVSAESTISSLTVDTRLEVEKEGEPGDMRDGEEEGDSPDVSEVQLAWRIRMIGAGKEHFFYRKFPTPEHEHYFTSSTTVTIRLRAYIGTGLSGDVYAEAGGKVAVKLVVPTEADSRGQGDFWQRVYEADREARVMEVLDGSGGTVRGGGAFEPRNWDGLLSTP